MRATGGARRSRPGTQGALGQLAQARADLTANGGAFRPLADARRAVREGAQLHADALGLNGAEGNARHDGPCSSAGPGYQFALSQGLDAVNRAATHAAAEQRQHRCRSPEIRHRLADQTDQQLDGQPVAVQSTRAVGDLGRRDAATPGVDEHVANLGVTGANILNAAGQNRAVSQPAKGKRRRPCDEVLTAGLQVLDTAEGSALAGNATNATSAINTAALGLAPRSTSTFRGRGQRRRTGREEPVGPRHAARGYPRRCAGGSVAPAAGLGQSIRHGLRQPDTEDLNNGIDVDFRPIGNLAKDLRRRAHQVGARAHAGGARPALSPAATSTTVGGSARKLFALGEPSTGSRHCIRPSSATPWAEALRRLSAAAASHPPQPAQCAPGGAATAECAADDWDGRWPRACGDRAACMS